MEVTKNSVVKGFIHRGSKEVQVQVLSTPGRDLEFEELTGEEDIYFVGKILDTKNEDLFFINKKGQVEQVEGWCEDEELTTFVKDSFQEAGLKLTWNEEDYIHEISNL